MCSPAGQGQLRDQALLQAALRLAQRAQYHLRLADVRLRQAVRRALEQAAAAACSSLRYAGRDLTAVSLRSDKASSKDLGLDDEGRLTLTNLANDRFACAVRLLVACSAARSLNVLTLFARCRSKTWRASPR